jgi:hypothetical protein
MRILCRRWSGDAVGAHHQLDTGQGRALLRFADSGLLSLSQARAAPSLASHQAVVDRIAEWHAAQLRATFLTSGVRGEVPPELTEFQKGLVAAAASFAAREKRRARPKTPTCYEEEERRSTARAPAVSELGRPRDIGASTYGLTCIKTITFAAPTVVRKTAGWRRRALVASTRD